MGSSLVNIAHFPKLNRADSTATPCESNRLGHPDQMPQLGTPRRSLGWRQRLSCGVSHPDACRRAAHQAGKQRRIARAACSLQLAFPDKGPDRPWLIAAMSAQGNPSRTSRAGTPGKAIPSPTSAQPKPSADLFTRTRPQTIIGGGRRQLPTGTRLTANQEAPRARCYSRCSTASLAFDPLLSRRQPGGLSLSQLRRLPRWWISVLERDLSLRGRKGPAGCHHSRSNLQANKQPINQKA